MTPIVWNGKPISRPGLYSGVPMRNDAGNGYHQNLCVRPSLSSTGIKTIFNKSPAHYFKDSYLNPDAEPPKDSEAFAFGRAAHHLLLGESGFRDQFVLRPKTFRDEEGKSKPWSGNTTYCRDWAKEQAALGLTVITEAELENIRGMRDSLKREPLVRAGILNGLIEHSMVWQDKETGVWLKARPDAMPAADMCVADLKTCADITDDGIERAISDSDLHVQAALVGMGLRALTGRETESFNLVFVEKAKPHCVRVRELMPLDLELGEQQIRAVLPIFAKAVETGVWHGPGGGQQDAQYAGVTPWRRKAIERQLQVLQSEAAV